MATREEINLRTRTARSRYEPRRDPYFVRLNQGVHIGYRRLDSGAGTWIGRVPKEGGKYLHQAFGNELDLDYDEACRKVMQWADDLKSGVRHEKKTVADVCRIYVENLAREKDEIAAYDPRKRFERLVYDQPFGAIELAKLVPKDVQDWRNAMVDVALAKAEEDEDEEADELRRLAKETANRNLKSLKAALNYGWKKLKLVSSDAGWKSINRFPGVSRKRDGLLTVEQRRSLLDAMQPELHQLAKALLLTGARPGEMAKANVSSFNRSTGILTLNGKTGLREVHVSDQARTFFTDKVKNRIGDAPMFQNPDEGRWTAPQWGKAFRETRAVAELPDAVMYCFRHTYISEAIKVGDDVFTIARMTGTSVEIIQKNYGHLDKSVVEKLNRVSVL